MRSNTRSLRRNRRAVSPAVSTVIITAATVVLVLVAGSYATQVIERQRASSEFETVTKSMLAFDDALRDIAWDREGSRSVRFTTNYGNMRLLPSSKTISITGPGTFFNSCETAVVKYSMPTTQFTLGAGAESYILGDDSAVVSSLTDSVSQAIVKQESGYASISLTYRVRVARETPATSGLNYVDILVIRLNCNSLTIGSGDFDLTARNIGLDTTTSGPYSVDTAGSVISVDMGEGPDIITLGAGTYMVNLIIADVSVSP